VVNGYLGAAARDFDGTLAMYRRFARATEPESLRDRLGDVRCPVLLLVGSVPQDAGVRPDEVILMSSRLPRFARQVVPGAGHFIAEEAPEAITSAVVRLADAAQAEAQVAASGGTDARAH